VHLILQRPPLSNLTNISASSSKNESEGQSIWPTSTKCMEVRQLSSRVSAISRKYATQKRIRCHPRNIRNSSNRNIPSMIRDGEFLQMYGPPQDCKGEVWSRDKSAQMYTAFRWRLVLLARMSCARVCPSKSVGRCKTIRRIRLETRRCDCSFVLATPMQTSVGKRYEIVVIVRESGSAPALPSRRRLFRALRGDGHVLVAA
jgi:hypothetical protein